MHLQVRAGTALQYFITTALQECSTVSLQQSYITVACTSTYGKGMNCIEY